ncbi:hypothetical protein ACFU53_22095 [Streptomyces sp. NPDC057474]|uniref:hypothetical protein n=1 Tax=Streptomyces sp. NPDC057474 TaxID=3346144 RepID=UPI003681F137
MGGWRVEVLSHHRLDGPMAPAAREVVLPLEPTVRRVVLADVGDGRIVGEGQDLASIGADGRERWRHRCAGKPHEAHVSGNRLLALTYSPDYHAWGFLGPALLFDLDSGRQIAELRGERGSPVGGGRFVLGLGGYDVFDTWLHDRDGTLLTTWRSYGHYVPDLDGTVRVVERGRSKASRVVRLLPDGGIERGPRLSHGQVSRPVVLADGTIVVLDAGVLRAVDRRLQDTVLAELLPVPPDEAWRFHGELSLVDDRLTVTVQERSREVPISHVTRTWSLAVLRPSHG